jgi:predicted O-methyltransferase YrrM
MSTLRSARDWWRRVLAPRAERAPPDRWFLESAADCREYLVTRNRWLAERDGIPRLLAVARRPDPADPVLVALRSAGLDVEVIATADIAQRRNPGRAAAIVCLDLDSRGIASAARACLDHPELRNLAFEYATATEREYATLLRHDDPHYSKIHFHSPLLTDPQEPFRIYEDSLKTFERKCDVRDFMDLYQALRQVVALGIPGDVAEFGAYKGHSGYLIAQTLKALGSERPVHLFDTFEAFPREAAGLDQFWSDTHEVAFADVRRKFAALPNVALVKGEFEQTAAHLAQRRLALVHVDCDSYRAIAYVARTVFPLLSPGGLMVFEDYGHPALLGARLAVDEFAAAHPECFRFFSQFSGLYLVQKAVGG